MAFDIQRSFDIQGFYDEVYGYNTDRRDTPPVDTVSVFDAGYISSSKAASLTKARTGYFALGHRRFRRAVCFWRAVRFWRAV